MNDDNRGTDAATSWTADEHGVYRPVREPSPWVALPAEAAWSVSAGTVLTLAPAVMTVLDAGVAYGAVGALVTASGVGAVATAHKVKAAPVQTAVAGVAGIAWGGFAVWGCLVPQSTNLAQAAVGGFLTVAGGFAAHAVRWKRAGTPLERATLDLENARAAIEVRKLANMPHDNDDASPHDNDDDPTRVIASTPWEGPRKCDGTLDTVEIAPGVFVPVDAHMLIGGATGGGKSGITDILMCSLVPRLAARVIGVDMKPGAPELGLYGRAGVRVVTGRREAAAVVTWLNAEMDRRGEEMRRLTSETGQKHALWAPTTNDPYLFLVIDELTEMLDTFDSAEKGMFYRLLRLSRAFAITLICATQSPRAKMFGEDAGASGRGQFGVRICLATKQSSETRLILDDLAYEPGWKDAHRMPKQGHFLIDAPGHAAPRIHRSFHADTAKVSALIASFTIEAKGTGEAIEATPVNEATIEGTQGERVLAVLGDGAWWKVDALCVAANLPNAAVTRAVLARLRKTREVESDGAGGHRARVKDSNVVVGPWPPA